MSHGIINEPIASAKYETKFNLEIEHCGFILSHEPPYLRASPDGLLGKETAIEIKCPYT